MPSRAISTTTWPFDVAGPSTLAESEDTYIKRRYFETLYLSDILSPIASLVSDILRLPPSRSTIRPLLLSLSEIEIRHRKTLSPLITALMTAHGSGSEVHKSLAEEAATASELSFEEIQVIRIASELRIGCRAVTEGEFNLTAKKVMEELERREVFIQIILLLLYTLAPSLEPDTESVNGVPSNSERPKKRRKRDRERETTPKPIHPADDPTTSLELLTDRLSVWQAVAELGIGADEERHKPTPRKGKERSDDGVQAMVTRFWEEVVLASFIIKRPDFCASFHLKLFGQPIPPKLLPVSQTKKARKPRITHPHPAAAPALRQTLAVPDRSRASSESRRGSSVMREVDRSNSMRRSASRTESLAPESRRSRSRSIDPVGHGHTTNGTSVAVIERKSIIRAPSGKDLFKGREVGLFRRTNSSMKPPVEKKEESQLRLGLLGRKTSDPKGRAVSSESQSQSQLQPQTQSHAANTIIFATPSKPRLFGSTRPAPQQWYHPTPIQEVPSSDERKSYVAETPVASRTGPLWSAPSIPGDVDEDSGEESDDPLGELMVMTDEEDEDGHTQMVPETPAR